MFLYASWKAEKEIERRTIRLRSQTAEGGCWLRAAGKGELALYCEPRGQRKFINAGSYNAPGVVALLNQQLPALEGRRTLLRVSSIPGAWLDAEDELLEFFGRLGFKASVQNRSLVLQSKEAPTKVIRQAGVALFALDPFARALVGGEELERIRFLAAEEFGDAADEVLALLDAEIGHRRLAKLLGLAEQGKRFGKREDAVRDVLRRIETKTLVQFHCGGGHLLQWLARSLNLERVVGIEPSVAALTRATARLEHHGEARHGSIVKMQGELPAGATVLLVEALPLRSDSRLSVAEELLFAGSCEWVLCVEGDRWEAEELKTWGATVTEHFGYRQRVWTLAGKDTAVLFRRSERHTQRHRSNLREPASRKIATRLIGSVAVEPKQWESTIEAFSRWTVDPRWLIYLPPGMASLQRERPDGYLEHPEDAFAYYRNEKIRKVVVELKHMGSRAIVIVCKDDMAARERFGGAGNGCIYTRNGRPFFSNSSQIICTLRDGLSRAHFWQRFKTDWVCLDGELLPWTLKAERLLSETHGELLAAGQEVLQQLLLVARRLAPEEGSVLEGRLRCFEKYRKLYEHYQSEAGGDVRFAPFHLIATEGQCYFEKDHVWHMTTMGGLARKAGVPFIETPYRLIPLGDAAAVSECIRWWEELSESGAEGVVVKPLHFVAKGRRGMAQPGMKCRGREHLRLVYGPEYDLLENRLRLLDRDALVKRRNKHRRVIRQFALSVEGVERFVRREPIERVEECVRGVMSLETREAQ